MPGTFPILALKSHTLEQLSALSKPGLSPQGQRHTAGGRVRIEPACAKWIPTHCARVGRRASVSRPFCPPESQGQPARSLDIWTASVQGQCHLRAVTAEAAVILSTQRASTVGRRQRPGRPCCTAPRPASGTTCGRLPGRWALPPSCCSEDVHGAWTALGGSTWYPFSMASDTSFSLALLSEKEGWMDV